LTIHPPPIKRPTHLGINTLPTIRQIRMQDLHNVGGDYKMLNVVDNVSVADVADIVVKTDFGI